MLLKLFKTLIHAATGDRGKQCPRCGSTNTNCENGIWYCFDCQKEFG